MSIDAVTNAATATPAKTTARPSAEQAKPVTTKASAPSGEQAVTPISPRLRYDASAGVVVTEFLDGKGSVTTSAPSTAVLAYLRAGLSEDGLGAKKEEA